MADDHCFHLDLGSRFENIELVQVVLREAMVRFGMDEDARHWVDVAVREAIANAIKHGNAQNPEKKVHVDLSLDGDELVIRIGDEGTGFDPALIHDPLAPENLLRPNGRGIFYMKSFMDEIHYGTRPGGGTEVILKKKVTRAQDNPEGHREEGTEWK